MATLPVSNRRILVVDDNAAIHEDFRKVLASNAPSASDLDAEGEQLFGVKADVAPVESIEFELISASQGQEALKLVEQSIADGKRFAMAFIDMRMPPGWDGLDTIRRIWQVDDQIETVICTAYSDHSWNDIQRALHTSDRLLILKKPFDKIEVMQLALALTEKWNLRRFAALQKEGLEELVKVRTRRLWEINKSKSELLTNVGHELLTPMNGILGMTSLLKSTELSEEQREYVDALAQSGTRLHVMVEQVLKFNRIEAGKLVINRSEFDPRTVCRNAAETYAAAASTKGVKLAVVFGKNLPERTVGDPVEVQSVLALLIDNAVKFTDRGRIEVRADGCDDSKEAVMFSVVDTGRGIDSARRELLNHDLMQLDSGPGRSAEGLGIGLTLTRQLLGLMQSKLEIESTPGQGSRFGFVLRPPANPVRPAGAGTNAAQAA